MTIEATDRDTAAFIRKLNEWRELTRKSFGEALRIKGRSLFGAVSDLTPPIGVSKSKAEALTAAGKNVASVSALKQGKAAVKRDILRAVRPLREQDFQEENIRRLIRGRHADVLEKIFGTAKRTEIRPFTPDLHERQRDRKGKVRKRPDVRFATFDVDAVDAYIREKQAHVGTAKGGWAAIHAALGGRPPAWVRDHSVMGTFQMDLTDPLKAYIHASNHSPWASVANEDRAIEGAVNRTVLGMEKEMDARMTRNLKTAGL